MMKTYDILLAEKHLGTHSYNCGDITVENWDKKSFKLDDYVKFRILLKKQSTEKGKDELEDLTSCYNIKAKVLGGKPTTTTSIRFENVQVTYSRLADIRFKSEEVHS